MSRRRPVPSLSEWVERATVGGPGPRPTRITAREELGLLLAVLRAADRGLDDWSCDCGRCKVCNLQRAVDRALASGSVR